MLIVGVVDEATDRSLGPEILIQIVPYILPKALMFAMPATCLFSACVVFGRLAADNELIAIQTMGLHKSVVIIPALVMAFLLSLFAVWVNDVSFAWSYWGIQKVVLESSDKIVYGVLKNEGSYKTPEFSIEVKGIEGRKLIHPVITVTDDKETRRVVAQHAELRAQPETHSLVFTMGRGHYKSDKFDYNFPSQEIPVSLKSPEEIAKSTGNPSHLYLSQIKNEITTQSSLLEERKKENAIRACSQMITGNLIGLTNADWESRMEDQFDAEDRLSRLHMVPHRRWANGFSCLAFVIIGIPVALRLRTANYATTFGICFLPILFIYYPLFMFGLNGAKMGTLPPYGAWLGNLACVIIGGVLMYREFKA